MLTLAYEDLVTIHLRTRVHNSRHQDGRINTVEVPSSVRVCPTGGRNDVTFRVVHMIAETSLVNNNNNNTPLSATHIGTTLYDEKTHGPRLVRRTWP